MEISFVAFKKELSQKGLVSGDKSHRLTLHELKIDDKNLHKLMDLPTDEELKVVIKENE